MDKSVTHLTIKKAYHYHRCTDQLQERWQNLLSPIFKYKALNRPLPTSIAPQGYHRKWHVVAMNYREWHVVPMNHREWYVVPMNPREWHVVPMNRREYVVPMNHREWHVVTMNRRESYVVPMKCREWHVPMMLCTLLNMTVKLASHA